MSKETQPAVRRTDAESCDSRALANDPDIILADEPTGALDSETGVQILDLIKEIAKNKLVIMVTHNRTGKQVCHQNCQFGGRTDCKRLQPYEEEEHKQSGYKLKMTAMNFYCFETIL